MENAGFSHPHHCCAQQRRDANLVEALLNYLLQRKIMSVYILSKDRQPRMPGRHTVVHAYAPSSQLPGTIIATSYWSAHHRSVILSRYVGYAQTNLPTRAGN